MNKDAVIAEIILAHQRSEVARLELNKLNNRLDFTSEMKSDINRIQSHFETDLAFRNGMAYALNVLGVLTDEDIEHLKQSTNFHIPDRFLDPNFRMNK